MVRWVIGLWKGREWGIGHGIGEQCFEPGGHLIHGQGHHVQADFQVIAVFRSHDSDNGCGVRIIREQGLGSKFGHRGVEPASLSRNVQKDGKVREAGMRGAAVGRAHIGFNRLECLEGFPGKAGQIDSNRGRGQSSRRSQPAGRYEKGERIRGIELELAWTERVRPRTEKRHLFVLVAKHDPVFLNRDVYRQIEKFDCFTERRPAFFQPDRSLGRVAELTLGDNPGGVEPDSDE